jgi:hypothetical protein
MKSILLKFISVLLVYSSVKTGISQNVFIRDTSNANAQYSLLKVKFELGQTDSLSIRRLIILAADKGDFPTLTAATDDYLRKIKNKFNTDNLSLLFTTLKTSDQSSFWFLLHNSALVDSVYKKGKVLSKLKSVIGLTEVDPYIRSIKNPDWDSLALSVFSKYGTIGIQKVYSEAMVYYFRNGSDWNKYAKYFAEFFRDAPQNTEYYINNLVWEIFDHCSDHRVLTLAKNVMEAYINAEPNVSYVEYDTYANILYKVGDFDEALKFEELAVRLSGNAQEILKNLACMKSNLPTWIE